MTTADSIAGALRPIAPGAKLIAADVPLINQLAAQWDARPKAATPKPVADAEPAWLPIARDLMGEREIVGPKHNAKLVSWWAELGAPWFNDDETPWCGLFVAHCMEAAGQPYPGKGQFARALAWKDWGKETAAAVGAVVVFQREGGGHVGFLVGENAANYYVLGGNQANMVSITPIAKARSVGIRWPSGLPLPRYGLPAMTGGTVSKNEA